MPLKITKATEPLQIEQLIVAIYGPPGVGKSSLGYSAESPLLLDFDNGAHRAVGRKDTVRVQHWTDVASISPDDLEGYKTLVVDTAGRALDLLAADIIDRNPKMGRGGALTLQGFGALKSEFVAWMKLVRSFGLDIVLIAHSDEKIDGDVTVERLDMQGASKNEIYKSADAMGRLAVRSGQRMLDFSPTETAFGKNPGQLSTLTIPDNSTDFLATVIAETKGAINQLTEDQQAFQAAMATWTELVDNAESPEDYTDLVVNAVEIEDETISRRVKAMIHKGATGAGFEYDQESSGYLAKDAA